MDEQPKNTGELKGHVPEKPSIALPLTALLLTVVPFSLILFIIFFPSRMDFAFQIVLWSLLSMLAGFILGIVSLSQGRKRIIGTAGKVMAILAILVALLPVIFVVGCFIGAATGLISLM
jgi:hypothetical protein